MWPKRNYENSFSPRGGGRSRGGGALAETRDGIEMADTNDGDGEIMADPSVRNAIGTRTRESRLSLRSD